GDASRTTAPTPRDTAHGLRRGRSAASALQRRVPGGAHRHRCVGGVPRDQHRRHRLRGTPTPHVDGVAAETGAGTVTPRRTTTKQALFEATLRLARGRGLGDVTVDEIVAAAGVAKGTVYYNFGSKDGLVEALLRYGVDELAAALTVTAEDSGPTDTLDTLVDNALRFISEYPGFAQILVSELWRAPGNWHETLRLLRGEVVGVLKRELVRL